MFSLYFANVGLFFHNSCNNFYFLKRCKIFGVEYTEINVYATSTFVSCRFQIERFIEPGRFDEK